VTIAASAFGVLLCRRVNPAIVVLAGALAGVIAFGPW
jgi:hypothetical protein